MKLLLNISFCLFSFVVFSQQSFFETLQNHGSDAIYQRYYSIYKNDDGKQIIAGKQYLLKAEILNLNNVTSGFKLVGNSKKDLAGMVNFDVTISKSKELIGYPNVSILVDRSKRKGYVAIDNYILQLKNVWNSKNGIAFSSVDAIYIKVDTETKTNKKKNKKKKFGSFMKKLKDAALNKKISECTSAACKKAESMDLKKYVENYLTAMKKKQDRYTLTNKDKSDISTLKRAVDDYYKMVNTKNAAYWNSPEGQAILENRRRANGYSKKNEVRLTNKTGRTIYIAYKGSRNQGTLVGVGQSTSWNCSKDAYLQQKLKKDTNTYYYKTTSQKVYRANNKCGGKFIIN